MLARVVVAFYHEPCGGVADAEVEDQTLRDQCVESMHQFRNGGSVIPEMDVVLSHDHNEQCSILLPTMYQLTKSI